MKRIKWALVLLITCSQAYAADILVVTKSGYWLLSQDAAGTPVLAKIESVIHMNTPTIPTDPPPKDPPTNPTQVHRAAVTAATNAVVDPNKANQQKALAELYRTVAGLPVANRSQLVQATDTLFGALDLSAWSAWKIAVDKSLAGFEALDDAKRAWVIVAEVLGQ